MLVKVIMCPCYPEKFHEEENDYIKKLFHVKCKCQDKHTIFTSTCKEHPLTVPNAIAPSLIHMKFVPFAEK